MVPVFSTSIGPYTGCRVMTTRTACSIIGWLDIALLVFAFFGGLTTLSIGIIGLGFICEGTKATLRGSLNTGIMGIGLSYRDADIYQTYTTHCEAWISSLQGKLAGAGVGTLLLAALCLIGPCYLLIGANKGKSSYLIPYLVLCGVKMLSAFVSVIVFMVSKPHSLLVIPFLLFGIETFKTFVIYCHYRYLTEKPRSDFVLNAAGTSCTELATNPD